MTWILAALLGAGTVGCGGEQGERGEQGLQGEQGNEGPQGEQGEPGEPGEQGPAGSNALVETEEVPPGDQCERGGVRIVTGFDTDADGELSQAEIDAGSTSLVCTQGCGDPLEVTGVTGTDQSFYRGIESAPLTVEYTSSTTVDFEFFNPALDYTVGSNPGEFTVTPNQLGGPFEVEVVASNGCSIDVVTFTVEQVEVPTATARLVNLVEGADTVDVAPAGTTTPLATLGYGQTSEPLELEAGSRKFDIIAGGTVIATTPALTLDLHQAYSIALYEDDAGNLALIQHTDDETSPSPEVRLTALNAQPAHPGVDVLRVADDGSTSALFSGVALGQASSPTTLTAPVYGLAFDTDADGSADLTFDTPDDLFADGDVANLYLAPLDSGSMLVVQFVDADGTSTALLPQSGHPAFPIDFEGAGLPASVSTGGDASWIIDTTAAAQGASSARSGDIGDNERSWMELSFHAPVAGTLQFDWQVESTYVSEGLRYCLNPSAACDSQLEDGSIDGHSGWTSASATVTAGPQTIRWVYFKDEAASSGADAGWVDNIRFTPSP